MFIGLSSREKFTKIAKRKFQLVVKLIELAEMIWQNETSLKYGSLSNILIKRILSLYLQYTQREYK